MVYDEGKYKITLKKVLSKLNSLNGQDKFEWVYAILNGLGSEFSLKLYQEGYEQGRFDEAIEYSTPEVELPDYVGYWLEYCKATNVGMANSLYVWNVTLHNYARMSDADKLRTYFLSHKNQEKFLTAWINSYKVKKEKYYYVAIPVELGRYRRLIVLGNNKVALGDHNYESHELLKKHSRQATFQLTEQMIKESPLSWAWQFAKELEDL